MATNRPESLITTLKAVGEFALMVVGIIGIAVAIFHEQGLLKQLINKLMNAALSTSLAAIVGIVVALALGMAVYNRIFSKAENAKALGNVLMKAMMVAGAFFLYRYITTGSFKI